MKPLLVLVSGFAAALHSLCADSFIIGWGQNVSGQSTGTPCDTGYSTGLVAVAGIDLTDTIAIVSFCGFFSHLFAGSNQPPILT